MTLYPNEEIGGILIILLCVGTIPAYLGAPKVKESALVLFEYLYKLACLNL